MSRNTEIVNTVKDVMLKIKLCIKNFHGIKATLVNENIDTILKREDDIKINCVHCGNTGFMTNVHAI